MSTPASNLPGLMGIWAHPDDEAFSMGGILARAARRAIRPQLFARRAVKKARSPKGPMPHKRRSEPCGSKNFAPLAQPLA